MNVNDYTICQFNMGSTSMRDYEAVQKKALNPENPLIQHEKAAEGKKGKEARQAIQEAETKFQSQIYPEQVEAPFSEELLANADAEVFCLQEVVSEERPLIRSLNAANYTIVKLDSKGKNIDTALALSNERFKDIKNHSFTTANGERDVAMATAIDKVTGQRVLFVSHHAKGFDLQNPNEDDVALADIDAEEIGIKIEELGCDITIVGADMNAPSDTTMSKQFKNLKNAGMEVHGTGVHTQIFTGQLSKTETNEERKNRLEKAAEDKIKNLKTNKEAEEIARTEGSKGGMDQANIHKERHTVEPDIGSDRARELDYIFTKTIKKPKPSLFSRIFSSWTETLKIHTPPTPALSWQRNPSDHLPIMMTVTPVAQKSLLGQFGDWLSRGASHVGNAVKSVFKR